MKWIYLSVILLITFGCSQKMVPEKPIPGNFGEPPKPTLSNINIPIEVSISDINKFIEKTVPNELYTGKEKGKDVMSVDVLVGTIQKEFGWEVNYTIRKNGKMNFTIDKNGVINFTLPLRVDAEGCAFIGIGAGIRKCGSSSPEIDLIFRSKISVSPDWSIQSQTTVAYDLKKAELVIPFHLGEFPLFNLKLNIKDDLQKPIDEQLKLMGKEVDKYITQYAKELKFKEMVEAMWVDYSGSINISSDPTLYMNIVPKSVSMTPLTNQNKHLFTTIGLSAFVSLSSEPIEVEKTPLPKLNIAKADPVSSFLIPVFYSYDSLSTYLERQYKDTTIVGSGYKLTVLGINIFAAGKHLIIDLEYSAKIKGVLKKVKGNMYFRTLPAFDKSTNTFYLEECELSSETNSLLTDRGMRFLANRSLNDDIKKMSSYNMDTDIQETIEMINKELAAMKIQNLKLTGGVEKLEFDGFYIEPERLTLYFKGHAKILSKIMLLE